MTCNGSRRRQAGFTLLEMLVVLGIIALVVAVALPYMPRRADAMAVRGAAQAVADGLRQTRGLAVRDGSSALFTLDVEARRWRIDSTNGEGGRGGRLPAELKLALETDRRLVHSPREAAIRFFPDGSSTGGKVELRKGEAVALLAVDWLTGKVSVDD